MLKLYFNYKDVFRAARLGFSPKKMWVWFCAMLLAATVNGVFGYLAHLIAGRSLADTWAMFGLVPLPWADFSGWSWLVYGIGMLIIGIVKLMAATMVAKISAEQLSGNEFYEVKEAMAFVNQNWKSVLGAPLVILSFVVFLLFCGAVLGFWGRIPLIGHWTVAILTVPIYFVCLFIAFLLAALAVALWYAPVIVGATKNDTFDSLFEVFSAITSQPWRLAVYSVLLGAVALAGTALFAWFTLVGLGIAFKWLALTMGGKFVDIALAGFAIYTPPAAINAMLNCLGSCYSVSASLPMVPSGPLGWAGHISAFLMGMGLNLVRLVVMAYAASTVVVGQTIIYGIVVMKRDERNIFEAKEEKPAELEPAVSIPAEGKPVKKIIARIKRKAKARK